MSSPTYNDNIPQPTDPISQSQPPILVNFNQLNSLFGVDHVKYDNSNQSQRGRHLKVTFSAPLSVDPNLASPLASLYTKAVSGLSELFFQNDTMAANVHQLTGNLVTTSVNAGTAGGSIFKLLTPWGVVMYAGKTNSINGTGFTVILPTPGVGVYYTLQATANNGAVRTANALIQTGVQFSLATSGNTEVNWLVLGSG